MASRFHGLGLLDGILDGVEHRFFVFLLFLHHYLARLDLLHFDILGLGCGVRGWLRRFSGGLTFQCRLGGLFLNCRGIVGDGANKFGSVIDR